MCSFAHRSFHHARWWGLGRSWLQTPIPSGPRQVLVQVPQPAAVLAVGKRGWVSSEGRWQATALPVGGVLSYAGGGTATPHALRLPLTIHPTAASSLSFSLSALPRAALLRLCRPQAPYTRLPHGSSRGGAEPQAGAAARCSEGHLPGTAELSRLGSVGWSVPACASSPAASRLVCLCVSLIDTRSSPLSCPPPQGRLDAEVLKVISFYRRQSAELLEVWGVGCRLQAGRLGGCCLEPAARLRPGDPVLLMCTPPLPLPTNHPHTATPGSGARRPWRGGGNHARPAGSPAALPGPSRCAGWPGRTGAALVRADHPPAAGGGNGSSMPEVVWQGEGMDGWEAGVGESRPLCVSRHVNQHCSSCGRCC